MNIFQLIKTLFEIALIGAFAFSLVYFVITLFALVHAQLRPKPVRRTPIRDAPSITVQIPTYNEIAALNCAERCLQFDYPSERLQIIIGDDSNDRDISRRIDAFAKKTRALKSADAATTSVTSPATSMLCCQNPLEITSSSLTPTFFPSATFLPVLSSPLSKIPN